MKAKRRSPVTGPLLTFGLMIGSVVAVGAIAHYVDTHQKAPTPEQTMAASASQASPATVRQ